ncbi:hypothetical protein NLJ89_g10076 [Agrocybe chaxingu]|uniref:Uncharacterized protein n=1 Tax=Agrocybe chaxingu TaxID=84603 RepID=A0A9W8MP96_9AGAR|nr:hypothetical protein NLJ89_g10076 [Agrocybe chaxingu]
MDLPHESTSEVLQLQSTIAVKRPKGANWVDGFHTAKSQKRHERGPLNRVESPKSRRLREWREQRGLTAPSNVYDGDDEDDVLSQHRGPTVALSPAQLSPSPAAFHDVRTMELYRRSVQRDNEGDGPFDSDEENERLRVKRKTVPSQRSATGEQSDDMYSDASYAEVEERLLLGVPCHERVASQIRSSSSQPLRESVPNDDRSVDQLHGSGSPYSHSGYLNDEHIATPEVSRAGHIPIYSPSPRSIVEQDALSTIIQRIQDRGEVSLEDKVGYGRNVDNSGVEVLSRDSRPTHHAPLVETGYAPADNREIRNYPRLQLDEEHAAGFTSDEAQGVASFIQAPEETLCRTGYSTFYTQASVATAVSARLHLHAQIVILRQMQQSHQETGEEVRYTEHNTHAAAAHTEGPDPSGNGFTGYDTREAASVGQQGYDKTQDGIRSIGRQGADGTLAHNMHHEPTRMLTSGRHGGLIASASSQNDTDGRPGQRVQYQAQYATEDDPMHEDVAETALQNELHQPHAFTNRNQSQRTDITSTPAGSGEPYPSVENVNSTQADTVSPLGRANEVAHIQNAQLHALAKSIDRLGCVVGDAIQKQVSDMHVVRTEMKEYFGTKERPSTVVARVLGKSRKGKEKKEPDPRLKHDFRQHFLTLLRRHLFFLLNIEDVKQLHTINPPDEEELWAFRNRLPSFPRITPDNWRYDFSRDSTDDFNLEALAVFEDHFLRCINDGWYPEITTPPEFKDKAHIRETLQSQLEYLVRVYAEQRDSSIQTSRLGRRRRRKDKLYHDRLFTVVNEPTLTRHKWLFERMGVDGVSSDESDTESDSKGFKCDRVFTQVLAPWRSKEFQDLQYVADESLARLRRPKVGCTKVIGSKSRLRVHSTVAKINMDSLVPIGLPRNCYASAWLNGLSPSQTGDLKILDFLYDFDTGLNPNAM